MLFTSFEFFLFLPITLLVFAALPSTQRWLWLLAASYVFYGLWHTSNLIFLGAVTIITYASARGIEDASERWQGGIFAGGLIVVLGSLLGLKYYDFAAAELERLMTSPGGAPFLALPRIGVTAPAGYSFYAFSAASYLIDAYVRKLPATAGLGQVALYVAYFPKILAGPIERATSFLPQIRSGQLCDSTQVILGLQLFCVGLFKKLVIADNLAPLVDHNFAIVPFATPMDLLISVYFFAFQIYCDFSGYTDMAIGISLLFGIRLMENFRHPYLSRSTAEFWGERWHISLSRWFRDYLYIPLGGSRQGLLRTYSNVMLVFLVSGLWHAGLGYGVGWSFLIWGALNGIYQWLDLATRPAGDFISRNMPGFVNSWGVRVIRVLLTFHLIAVTWIFFRAKSISDAVLILRKLASHASELPGLVMNYPFTNDHLMGFSLIGLLVAAEIADERRPIIQRIAAAPVWLRWGLYYGVIFSVIVLGRWQMKEFIYMRF
jgi:D-alanyl-lipoteichoic acid acyltransferase DltB (MBOAT superfamily)